jgi:hypothetical protein
MEMHMEVVAMSTPTVPQSSQNPPQPAPIDGSAQSLTIMAFLAPLTYLIWFWVMFAAGYWLTDLFDAYPSSSTAPALASMGVGGWLANLAYFVVLALPSWVGAGLAVRARRQGGGAAALVALGLNLLLIVGCLVLGLVSGL